MQGSGVHALKPYPSYRESGVPWLGKVPAHWETLRIKNWLAVNQSVLPEDTDPNYAFDYLEIGSIGTGRVLETPETVRFEDSPSRARRIVKSGDTIVSTVRTYLKAVWHADNLNSDLVASTGFAVLSPRSGAYPKFVSYLWGIISKVTPPQLSAVRSARPSICDLLPDNLRTVSGSARTVFRTGTAPPRGWPGAG